MIQDKSNIKFMSIPTDIRFKDRTGLRYHQLIVLGLKEKGNGSYIWYAQCDCGNITAVAGQHLQTGHTHSCGCRRRTTQLTHGMHHTSIYQIWADMKQRCSNPKLRNYHNYGGRGIKVCERWLRSFENFYVDMGDRPTTKHSLERVNNDGDYCPENCKWALHDEQVNNKRTNYCVFFQGIRFTVAQLARKTGIHHATLSARLHRGLDVATAVTMAKYQR